MADKKISQLTAKGSKIASTDRVPIAQDNGGGTFATKYVTGAEINEVLLDTSPQLGGDLDVNGNKITSASNGNIKIEPNGTGAVLIGGNDTQPSELRFMELLSNGSSYVGFKAPDDIITSRIYTLPTADGTSGQVLSTNGTGTLSWATAGGGITVGTTAVTSGTDGRVFFQAGGVVQQDAAFFWDNTNKRLGVGATPSVELDVNGRFNFYQTNNGKGRLSLINNTGTGNFLTFTYTAAGYPGTSMFNAGVGFNFVGGNNYHGEITLARTAPSGLITTRIGASNDSYLSESNLVIGATTAGARLDVRAKGALSTDIAFRVRNSANTVDLFSVQGNAITNFGGGTSSGSQLQVVCGALGFGTNLTLQFASSKSISCINGGQVETGIRINHNSNTRVAGLMIGSSTGTQVFIDGGQNIRIGQGYSNTNQPDANATRTIQQMTGVAPTTSVADGFQQYSADITAGNAAPHFRTENGAIVKIYQETTGVAAATFVANTSLIANDTATFDGYTIGQVVKALRNLGILA